MPLVVNKPFSPTHFSQQLNVLQLELLRKHVANHQLTADIAKLIRFGRQLLSCVGDYDFKGVHANGYRSVLKLGLKLLQYGAKMDIAEEEHFQRMVSLFCDAIGHVNELIADSRRAKERDGGHLIESSSVDIVTNFIATFLSSDNDENFRTLFGPLNGFDGSKRFNEVYFSYLMAAGNCSWTEYFSSLMSKSSKNELIIKSYRNLDIDLVQKQLSGSTNWIYTKLISTLVNGFGPATRETFFVTKPRKWRLKCDVASKTINLEDANSEAIDPIRCRVLRHGEPNGSLIVYAHGGGFVSSCAESHEVFLRHWTTKLAGVTFLNIDYGLAPQFPFPDPVQQILDVYNWLLSGETSVKDAIGFTDPTRIAFAGDSSGALILMSTILVINDLRRLSLDTIRLPDGFLGIYSSFMVAPRLVPSNLMSAFNVMLFPTVVVNVVDAFYPRLAAEEDHRNILELVKDRERLTKHFRDNETLLEHPYMSPLNYEHLEDLAHLQLHLIAVHSDPVLDYSVAMARRWRGDVTLNVLDDLNHGFLNFIFLGLLDDTLKQTHEEATQLCCGRLSHILKLN